jgi:hypothetical protein
MTALLNRRQLLAAGAAVDSGGPLAPAHNRTGQV